MIDCQDLGRNRELVGRTSYRLSYHILSYIASDPNSTTTHVPNAIPTPVTQCITCTLFEAFVELVALAAVVAELVANDGDGDVVVTEVGETEELPDDDDDERADDA